MKIRSLVNMLFFSSLLMFFNNASAETTQYKWKDANGEVHYTERPPAQGIKYDTIRIKSSVSNQSPQKPINSQKAQEQKPEDAQDEKYNGWRKENCKRAVQNLDILENAGRISQDDGQGGKRLMSDEEKQEKIKAMTEQKQKYCTDDAEGTE